MKRFKLEDIDTPPGHIVCVLLIFLIGAALYICGFDYGKEVMAGSLGSLWTLLQVQRGSTNIAPGSPGVVNQAEHITVTQKES